MLNESRRRAYMTAMQVVNWLPRTELPFAAPSRPELLAPLAPQVEDWLHAPHPGWAELVEPGHLRAYADAWAAARRPSVAWDERVFELVALDRFLRTWFPA